MLRRMENNAALMRSVLLLYVLSLWGLVRLRVAHISEVDLDSCWTSSSTRTSVRYTGRPE